MFNYNICSINNIIITIVIISLTAVQVYQYRKLYVWSICKNITLVNERLAYKWILVDIKCCLYGEVDESVDHIFKDCPLKLHACLLNLFYT